MLKRNLLLAKSGNVDAIVAGAGTDKDGRPTHATLEAFRWLLVAAALGSEEAEDMVDTFESVILKHCDDEAMATVHFDVARWWLLGEEGLPVDVTNGIEELETVKRLGAGALRVDLAALRAKLHGDSLAKFDRLFAKSAKKPTKKSPKKPAKKKSPKTSAKASPKKRVTKQSVRKKVPVKKRPTAAKKPARRKPRG